MKKNISKSPNPFINIVFWYINLTDIYANDLTLLLYFLNRLPVNLLKGNECGMLYVFSELSNPFFN